MTLTEEVKSFIDGTISSYEARLQSMESLLEPIQQTQESFLETKQEQEKVNSQLRESLAKNNHLRKKDFDQMMQGIVSIQDEKEKSARSLLADHLDSQKEMTGILRDILSAVRNAIHGGDVGKVKEFQSIIKELLIQQEKKKEKVTLRLKEFQQEQVQIISRAKELLAKGEQLRVKDLKQMLMEFRMQHKERIEQKLERKKEVNNMLVNFKNKRKQWRTAKMALSVLKDDHDSISSSGN
jgi:hypothetical protein